MNIPVVFFATRKRQPEITTLVKLRRYWIHNGGVYYHESGHVERMVDDRLPKRVAELLEQGRRRRGRPRLRWEDCVKRDVRKAGEEED